MSLSHEENLGCGSCGFLKAIWLGVGSNFAPAGAG